MSDQLQYWPIEFLLVGKADYYPGVCRGTDPHDAMKVLLENYSPKGTIMAIRAPDFGPDSKMFAHLLQPSEHSR
jgi:hypothetical protein